MQPNLLQRNKPIQFILLLGVAVIMLYPLLWMLSSSFKPNQIIFTELGLWPSQITADNYVKGWQGFSGLTFSLFFRNSFVLVFFAILGNVITCSMTAYAFARIDFSMKKICFAVMMGTIMLPHHVVLIPQYMLFHKLDWVNTYLPLIVPKFLATDAFFIFLMVQFIRGLPLELDNAARVDGCGPVGIFMKVIFPLLLPALVTTSIFTFIWTWNDFLSQLIYISNPKLMTVTLALRAFMDSAGESSFGSLFAMSILSLIPIFIFFVSFQKLLIEGIATSGLKG
ncbi:carbohydrate ABC transporter permease [Paenibacillus sp. TAB 01]|uniref:carbohydrate ABC transporter permease n=1 Tax=Paenibacillus sp. TAB 01 TaxID=3368988 RepID=UPI0037538C09